MKTLPLTMGYEAIVDDADYAMVSQWKWRALVRKAPGNTRIYAARKGPNSQGCLLLHREIVRPEPGLVVDHINGNCLDNRRENLRACTHAQNLANAPKRIGNTSGFKGVHRHHHDKWTAKISANGCVRYLGVFADKHEAARAYDVAAAELHGEFAQLNFPGEQEANPMRERALAMLVNSYTQQQRD